MCGRLQIVQERRENIHTTSSVFRLSRASHCHDEMLYRAFHVHALSDSGGDTRGHATEPGHPPVASARGSSGYAAAWRGKEHAQADLLARGHAVVHGGQGQGCRTQEPGRRRS